MNIPYWKHIMLILFGITLFETTFCQNSPVKVAISSEKVIIDGQVYYIHEVKQGETLYSIGKAYNIPLKEITKENPDVLYGLMIGHILKIPFVEKENKEDDQFIYHYIQKGQTIYSLTKKYGIDTSILYQHNPEARLGLKFDAVLKIPKQRENSKPSEKTEDENYFYHKVKRKETLYSLSKLYNITIKEIKDLNPELLYSQLKTGQSIKIPKFNKKPIFDERDYSAFIDTSYYSQDSIVHYRPEEYNCEQFDLEKAKNRINVALMMPFYMRENESLNEPDTNAFGHERKNRRYQIYKKSYPILEFYEGLLLAIDTLKKAGLSVNLYTYSVEDDTNSINQIINELILTNVDLVIGPVYSRALEKMVQFSTKYKVPVVLPFQVKNEILLNNPYVFSGRPSITTENERIANLISYHSDKNIVLVRNNSFIDSLKHGAFKYKLFEKINTKPNLSDIIIKELIYNETFEKSLEHSLSLDNENFVFVNSKNETFISEIITKLNGLTYKYDITILGYPCWQWYKNIDVEYYYNLQLKYITPFFIDYESEQVKSFLKKHREIYHTEPSGRLSYSYLGYDIMDYFGNAIWKYGKSFPYCLSVMDIDLLHSDFKFYRINASSGFENMGGHIYHYIPSLKIKKYDLGEETFQPDDGE